MLHESEAKSIKKGENYIGKENDDEKKKLK